MHSEPAISTRSARALAQAMRRLSIGGLTDPAALGALEPAFGGRALNVLILVQIFLARLSDGAARPILLAEPCCRRLSGDEQAAIRAVEAVAGGNWAAAHALIDPLVRPEAAAEAVEAAAWLAEALADCGLAPTAPVSGPSLH